MEHHDWATGRASTRSQGFRLQVSHEAFPVELSGIATHLVPNSVAFSPDGNSLVSGSLDRSLRVWDLSGTKRANQQNAKGGQPITGSGTCAHTLTGHKVSCGGSDSHIPCGVLNHCCPRLGLCLVCRCHSRWTMGRFRVQGSKHSILEC